jgi:hypothetical protein
MTPYVVGLVAFLVLLGVVFPARVQRMLALFISAYRHKKQIDAGTEVPHRRSSDFTISASDGIHADEIKEAFHSHRRKPHPKEKP